MKTIGLLGGMSWESTELYYRRINQLVKQRLGGLHSAKVVLYSVDFQEVETLQQRGDWDRAGEILAEGAKRVAAGGADFLLICTNTMHRVAPAVENAVRIPLLHLADATGEKVRAAGLRTIGLLGTNFTMVQDFYRGRLENRYGLKVLVPPPDDRAIVHAVIYNELCLGSVREESRNEYLRIMAGLQARGAEGVIEGCTEIGILVQQAHTDIPLFDTTAIHCEAAVDTALAE